jgi:hypothetical protein
MAFNGLLAQVARLFEAIGAVVLVVGLIWSVVVASLAWRGVRWLNQSRPGKGSSTPSVLSLVTARNEISGNETYRGRRVGPTARTAGS